MWAAHACDPVFFPCEPIMLLDKVNSPRHELESNPVYGSLAWEITRGFLTGRFQYYLKTFFASMFQYLSLLHFP